VEISPDERFRVAAAVEVPAIVVADEAALVVAVERAVDQRLG
jgi:hypothetical protein